MACENQIGVKNILISFTDCDTGQIIRKVSHKLSNEDLPQVKTCGYTNEPLPGGYIRRIHANASILLNVIRSVRIPLSYYQGCASIDIQVEYLNGLIYTGVGGSVTGDETSDTHDVPMQLSFRVLEETLPAAQFTAVDVAEAA